MHPSVLRKGVSHIVWKWTYMSYLTFLILTFSNKFCPIKTDMYGNTVWSQDQFFKNSPDCIFGIFS